MASQLLSPTPQDDESVQMTQRDVEERRAFNDFKSPMRVIKEWIPTCDEALVPKLGLTFDDLEQCENFYKTYADHAGFSVRKSSSKKNKQGVDEYKYFVCSKEGYRENSFSAKYVGKAKVRTRKLTRVGCKALAGFKRTAEGKYVLRKFYEGHTHVLATPNKYNNMQKSNCREKSMHRALVKSSAGPSKARDFMEEEVGGFENAACSSQALELSERDLKAYINGSSAQMFLEILERKKLVDESFYFAYELDGNQTLKNVFWADGTSRRNYVFYGDVVSFHAISDTNRYKKIFASFTGFDNHRLCVSFGGAFLGDDKSESFIWLFERFLEAMRGRKPACLITDQDAAVKLAIQRVFDTSSHRYCMSHIMRKLSEKVGCSLNSNVDFNTRLKSCVCDSETSVEFEATWQSIMEDFGLTKNDWLSEVYSIREMWVPAYFRDLFLGGVQRTTSRSESENSFFSNFTNPHLSLVEFFMPYQSAIDLQRYNQSAADGETSSSVPQLKTNKDLEKHAAQVYTHSNFYRFQGELWVACMDCEVDSKEKIEEGLLITIADASKKDRKMRQVIYNPSDHVAHCSCKMFECDGIPCRHILCILKGKLHELPSYYILNRWTKMATCKPVFGVDCVSEGRSRTNDEEKLISDIWKAFITCMELAGRDLEELTLVSKALSAAKKQLMELKGGTSESRVQDLEPIGSSTTEQVEILSSKLLNSKGSGKRIGGGKEPVTEPKRRRRLCRACGEQSYHDSRNCPSKVSS